MVRNEEPKYVVMTWDEYDKIEKMMEKLKMGGDFSGVDPVRSRARAFGASPKDRWRGYF